MKTEQKQNKLQMLHFATLCPLDLDFGHTLDTDKYSGFQSVGRSPSPLKKGANSLRLR